MAAFTVAELENMVIVNMGDYKTAKGEKKLMTKDLGSCVGVALRDPHTGVGGKAHIHRVYSGKRYGRYASTAPRNEGAEHQCRQLPDYVGKQGRGGQHSGSLSPRQSMA